MLRNLPFRNKGQTLFKRGRMHPLLTMAFFIVALVVIIFFTHLTETIDQYDKWVLGFIATVYLCAAVFMFINTKWDRWNLMSAGLLATFCGDALLYGSFSLNGFKGEPIPYYLQYLVGVRALFIVGGIWVAVGIYKEWRHSRKVKEQNDAINRSNHRSVKRGVDGSTL